MIAALPFGVVGLVFAAIGVGTTRSLRRFRRIARRTRGEIVSLSISRAGWFGGQINSSGSVYPTIRFTTEDGREVTAQSHIGSSPAPGRVGHVVGVLYDPNHPERVRVDNLRGRGGCLGAIFLTFGTLLLAIAVVIVVVAS